MIGASGFLGSHVTRQLAQRGDDVRVLIRQTSSTKALDDLDVEYHYGDIFDDAALRAAMASGDDVFYCVADTRAWLRDPAPLFQTNVEGLRHVLDAAVESDLRRFVFTSSIATIGIRDDGRPANEEDQFNWADKGGGYIQSRVQAENQATPRTAACPQSHCAYPTPTAPPTGNSHRTAPWWPRMPYCIKGSAFEVVGVEDAATALILAAAGRSGDRYIISERFMSARELYEIAADACGTQPPRFGIPLKAMYVMGFGGDLAARVLRRDVPLSVASARLMHIISPMDHG